MRNYRDEMDGKKEENASCIYPSDYNKSHNFSVAEAVVFFAII